MSQQAVSADAIPKTGGTKTKAALVLIRRLPRNLEAYILST
jgi:hypothetical protein